MIIRKDEKEYTVAERKDRWEVSRKIGALTVDYKVPKSICVDEAALREYIEKEELF